MANNKIQILLDLLVNLKSDPGQINQFVAQIEQSAKKLNISIDTDKTKKAVTDMVKSLDEAETALKQINSVPLEKLELEFKNVERASSGFMDRLAKFGMISMGVEQFTQTINQFQQPFAELDKQVRNIGTLGVKNFQEFADRATELSISVPDSAVAIAEGVYDAISAGTIKVKDGVADVAGGMQFVETASKLAAAGLTTTKDSINGLTSVMNAYGLEANQAGKVADTFFGAVNVGKTTIPELNASLAQVIPTAASFGVEFDQVAASIATMTKQGTPTAQAATQIRAALVELAKPGAELAPILQKAGVSLDSLKKEGLQESFKKIGIALDSTGKSATQVFGSVEAASAVMLLSGKNAAMAASDLDLVKNSIGSTDAAFAVASEGIDSKSKMLMNSIQAGFNEAMSVLGSYGQLALSTAAQVAPLMTSFTGLATLIPAGTVGKVGELGKTILTKLVPGLMGAATAQGSLNAVMGMNPIFAVTLAVTGLVAGLKLLSEALHETAQEKLKDAESQDKLIDKEIEAKEKEIELAESKQKLVEEFKNTGESAMENVEMMTKLSQAYPGVIDASKSYQENLAALSAASNKTKEDLAKLTTEIGTLAEKKLDLQLKISNLKVDVEKQNIENTLKDAFKIWGLSDASEWIFGTSTARQMGEQIIKPYTDAISNAKNSKELEKASLDFQMAIFNSKDFEKLTAEEKTKMLKGINKMVEARKSAMDSANQNAGKDFEVLKDSGMQTGQIIDFLAKKYNATKEEIKGIIDAQERSKQETIEQTASVESLAAAWNKVKADAKKSLDENAGAMAELLSKGKENWTQEDFDKWDQYKKAGFNAHKAIVEQAKIDEQVQKALGITVAKNSSEKKSQLELLTKEFELYKQKAKYDSDIVESEKQLSFILQEREKTTYDDLAAQERKIQLAKDEKEKFLEIYKALVSENESGGLDISPKLKKEDRMKLENDYKQIILNLKNESNKELELKAKIKLDQEEFNKSFAEFKKQQLEYDITLGLKNPDEMVTLLQEQLTKIDQKIAETKAKMEKLGVLPADATPEMKAQIASLDKSLLALSQERFNLEKDISSKKKAIYDDELKAIATASEDETKIVEEKYSKTSESLKRFNELWTKSSSVKIDYQKDQQLNDLKSIEDEKLKVLDSYKEMGVISAEDYEARKTRITEEGEAKRAAIEEKARQDKLRNDALAKGMEKENERKHSLDLANITKKSAEEQMNILNAKKLKQGGFLDIADKTQLDNLKEQFDKANDVIAMNANSLITATEIAGTGFADAITQFMAGDSKGAIDALRASWGEILGVFAAGLKKWASGLVLELLFGELSALSPTGFLALVAVPVLKSIAEGAIGAIIDPFLNDITSFATGAKFDQPTLLNGNIQVGDAALNGGKNREWLLNDRDFQMALRLSAATATMSVVAEMRAMTAMLANQKLETKLTGRDARIMLIREQSAVNKRAK